MNDLLGLPNNPRNVGLGLTGSLWDVAMAECSVHHTPEVSFGSGGYRPRVGFSGNCVPPGPTLEKYVIILCINLLTGPLTLIFTWRACFPMGLLTFDASAESNE